MASWPHEGYTLAKQAIESATCPRSSGRKSFFSLSFFKIIMCDQRRTAGWCICSMYIVRKWTRPWVSLQLARLDRSYPADIDSGVERIENINKKIIIFKHSRVLSSDDGNVKALVCFPEVLESWVGGWVSKLQNLKRDVRWDWEMSERASDRSDGQRDRWILDRQIPHR